MLPVIGDAVKGRDSVHESEKLYITMPDVFIIILTINTEISLSWEQNNPHQNPPGTRLLDGLIQDVEKQGRLLLYGCHGNIMTPGGYCW